MTNTRAVLVPRLGRVALFLASAAPLLLGVTPVSAQGIGFGVAPDVAHVRWSESLRLDDATLFGGNATLEFGDFVRLQAGLRHAESIDASFDDLGLAGLDSELDLTIASTTVLARLGSRGVAPMLAATGGVMRFLPDGREAADQIFVALGGGLGFRLGNRFDGRVLVQDLRFRADRALFAPGTITPVDPEAATTRGNLSASLGLGIRFGGTASPTANSIDENFDGFLRGRADGLMVPVGIQGGVIRFDDALGIGDQATVGVSSGIDLGPYFGLRGTYWRGVEDDIGSFEGLSGWSGDAQFNIGPVTDASPFLTIGYGQVRFENDFLNDQGQVVPDQNALVLGAGFGYPLLDRLRVVAAIKDHVTTSGDLDDTSTPSDLRHSVGVEAGLSFRLWGRSTDATPVPVPAASPVPGRVELGAASPLSRADSIIFSGSGSADSARSYQSDRVVTIPLPTVGEIYLRYGDVDQTPSRFAPAGSATGQAIATDSAGITDLIREELARLTPGAIDGGITRAELDALEVRLLERFAAALSADRIGTPSPAADLTRLEAEVRELTRIIREGAIGRSPLLVPSGAAGTGAAPGAVISRPFYRGVEARLGTAGVRHGGVGVGGSLAVSLGNVAWPMFRPFVGLEAGRTSVRTRFGPSSVIGSVVSAGVTVGTFADFRAFGPALPSVSVALAALGGPVSGDTDQDEELMDLLYDGFGMGPEIGAHLGYRRPGFSQQITLGMRRLFAGSRSRWAIEAGLRVPGSSVRVAPVAPAPPAPGISNAQPTDPVQARTPLAEPAATPAVMPGTDPLLVERLRELEDALARETAARSAATERADSVVRSLEQRAAAAADSAATRDRLRSELESAAVRLPDIHAVRQTSRGLELILGGDMFEVGSATLDQQSRAAIGELADRIRTAPYALLVEGHTDSTGSDENNLRLSLARAESVRLALLASGIDPARITASGSGETVPIADNATAAGRAANRRVEIVLLRF